MLLTVGTYVDDLVTAGAEPGEVKRFKGEMQRLFSMSDLGLGVNQERGRATITQTAYAAKIMERAGMSKCHTVQAPMEAWLKLSKESVEKPVDATLYCSISEALGISCIPDRTSHSLSGS